MSAEAAVRLAGDVSIVDMKGRLMLGEGCSLLRNTVKELLESGRRQILLSLNGVTNIDSSGLCELAACYATASRLAGSSGSSMLRTRSTTCSRSPGSSLFS